MSAKVSTVSSVGSSAERNPGAGASPNSGGGVGAGHAAGSAGVGGSSGSAPAAAGSGPGSHPRSTPGFSAALAEAAHAGRQPAQDVSEPSGRPSARGAGEPSDADEHSKAAAERDSGVTAPADNNAAARAAATSKAQLGASVPPALNPEVATSNISAADPVDTARADKTPVKALAKGLGKSAANTNLTSDGARSDAIASGSTPPTDPLALAMLIAASGTQVGGGAIAGSAGEERSSPALQAGDDKAAPLAALSDVGQSASPVAVTQPSATARDAAAALAAASPAAAATSAPLALRSVVVDAASAQPSVVVGSAGLPDLARSLAAMSPTLAVQSSVAVPVSDPQWPHAVAAQVQWFVNNDVQSATLRLSPEHLGPIEVHIDMRQAQVDVSFYAHHAETRAALEQTVPRLRELFASGGLTLGQANVQQDPRPGSHSGASPARSAFAGAQTVEPVAVASAQGLHLLDEYA
jgi:flagellar hook-length control protein FliK